MTSGEYVATPEQEAMEIELMQRRVKRALGLCSRTDLFLLRAVIANWKNVDEVILSNASAMAEQICQALDALGALRGEEVEAELRAIDEGMRKAGGSDASS